MSNVSVDDFRSEKARSATRALCWKQWQELLAPMGVLTLASFVLLTVFGFLTFKDHSEFFGLMAAVPTSMIVCFTFACCFVSFVSEKESRTSSFLVGLPLSSVHVGVVKILMVIVAVLIFCVGQALMAGGGALLKLQTDLVARGDWEIEVEQIMWPAIAISIYIAFTLVIGLISCSLWSRSWYSVIAAFILGSYATVVGAHLYTHFRRSQESQLLDNEAWGLVATLVLLVVGAIWFPLRWLRRRPSGWASRISNFLAQAKSSLAGSDVARSQSQQRAWGGVSLPRGGRFGALLWQSVLQQNIVLMLCSFFLVSMGFSLLSLIVNPASDFFQDIFKSIVPSFFVTGLAAGWLTLNHDKKDNNLEFFQQHREHGIALMIARIIPPIAVLLVLAVIASGYHSEMAWRVNFRWGATDPSRFGKLLLFNGFTFYSAALLCSMVFRSQVYALGVALVVSVVLWGTKGHGDSFSWMLVLPLVWLVSSVAYGPRWLSGRRSWVWTAYFTCVLLCAFAPWIYALVCWWLGVELELIN